MGGLGATEFYITGFFIAFIVMIYLILLFIKKKKK